MRPLNNVVAAHRGGMGVIASVEDCFDVVALPVAVRAGSAVVAVRRAGAGCFRLSVRTGWPGVEVAPVCGSFRSEAGARQAARVATTLLGSGWTARQVVNVVGVLAAGSHARRRRFFPMPVPVRLRRLNRKDEAAGRGYLARLAAASGGTVSGGEAGR